MRHNQRLSYEDLRDETAEAVQTYAGTQSELAEKLGVHKSSISRAIREAGPAFSSLQMRILEEAYPDYLLEAEEPVVTFRVRRRE